jgi:hypothetical protein
MKLILALAVLTPGFALGAFSTLYSRLPLWWGLTIGALVGLLFGMIFGGYRAQWLYVVFDLLYHRGRSLLDRPLSERRRMLHEELPELPFVSLCEGVLGDGKAFFHAAVQRGFEGVVAKRPQDRPPA